MKAYVLACLVLLWVNDLRDPLAILVALLTGWLMLPVHCKWVSLVLAAVMMDMLLLHYMPPTSRWGFPMTLIKQPAPPQLATPWLCGKHVDANLHT